MNIVTQLGSFAIVGIVGSLIVEYTKNFLVEQTAGKRTFYGLLIAFILGLIVYFWHLIPDAWLTDVVGVVAAMNTAYVFLVQYLPNLFPSTPAAPSSPAATPSQ